MLKEDRFITRDEEYRGQMIVLDKVGSHDLTDELEQTLGANNTSLLNLPISCCLKVLPIGATIFNLEK